MENYTAEIQKQIDELPSEKMSSRTKNKIGTRQGRLTYVKFANYKNQRGYWWVRCDCGNFEQIRADHTKTECTQCSQKTRANKVKQNNYFDLTNQKFNKLTAIYRLDERKNGNIVWHCKCECGNEIDVQTSSLTSGNTKSCGCLRAENAYFHTTIKSNLVDQKFGKLLVLEETKDRQYGKVVWKCQCDCGNIIYLHTGRLISGNDISCGCIKSSTGEKNTEKILLENNILYQKQYRFKDFNKFSYDFAIINDLKEVIRLIEFDGEQHFRPSGGWNTPEHFEKIQKYDKEKNEYALSHNIPLVRIPYWERDKITLEMILGSTYEIQEPGN